MPDDSVIVADRVATAVPGAGRYRYAATRDAGGSYAMVYAPVGRSFKVRMDAIKDPRVKAWWFNPRDGTVQTAGEFPNTGECEFTPPEPGEMLDWEAPTSGYLLQAVFATGAAVGRAKLAKAKKLGVSVLDEAEFLRMLEQA